MSKMIMYIDGSERQLPKKDTVIQGWGLLALDKDGDSVELFGTAAKKTSHRGYHELHAFVAAIEFAEKRGLIPSETTIYTDDELIAYGGFHLVPANYSRSKKNLIKRLRAFQAVFHPNYKTLVLKMIRWMIGAKLHWIKGHRVCVHNNRADYLARCGSKTTHPKDLEPYDRWLKTVLTTPNPYSNNNFIGSSFLK